MQAQKPSFISANPTLLAAVQVVSKGGISKLIRAAYRAAPLLLYLPGHLKMMRVLKAAPVSELLQRRPKLGYKYLYRPYLVQSLSKKQRLEALDHHYRFLAERVKSDFFSRIYDGEYELWQDSQGDCSSTMTLSFPVDWEHDYEGDLLLNFNCNGERIYSLTFSIVPGHAIGLAVDRLILVTAIQGAAGMAERIKLVKESYGDLSPPMLLLSGIEGVALSMDIPLLGGIGLDQQVQKQTWGSDRFMFDYDQFWKQAIGERTEGAYYVRKIPEELRPLEEIKGKHRKKTLLRRRIKASIREIIHLKFEEKCLTKESVRRPGKNEDLSKQPEE
jgi:uncharacterized protein VirK/YbjX